MKLDITLDDINVMQNLCGPKNDNIKKIEELYKCQVSLIGNQIYCECSEDDKYYLESLFSYLKKMAMNNQVSKQELQYINELIKSGKSNMLDELFSNKFLIGKTFNGKSIYPKTLNQKLYIHNIMHNDIIFGVGPAGVGKTYLAVIYACNLLKKEQMKKIILTRPAVEAGESLGYLPGDLKEKIDPYLRPLYDALYDALGVVQVNSLIEHDVIEIAPLAYMRGRTLENACIILDEAQNTTQSQMKMFLTRLGNNSKMIITGDITQIDLPRGVKSGLIQAIDILGNIEGIATTMFDSTDVVRNPLVAKIIER